MPSKEAWCIEEIEYNLDPNTMQQVTVSSLEIRFAPIETDLFSMEQPLFLREVYLEQNNQAQLYPCTTLLSETVYL